MSESNGNAATATQAQPPATQPAAPAAAAAGAVNGTPAGGQQPAAGQQQAEAPVSIGSRIGTVVTVAGVGLVVIILADIALKGRLLGPLFALLGRPGDVGEEEGTDGVSPSN